MCVCACVRFLSSTGEDAGLSSQEMTDRVQRFLAWISANDKEEDGALVGKGNYGQVFRRPDGSVVKVVDNVKRTGGSAKLAYREHVMSFLQTVLVLRSHCAHVPMHYGFAATPNDQGLSMRLYIEAFDCTVDSAPKGKISSAQDWAALLFQVLSAILCVARLLDVCHNDIYPRNVLLKLEPCCIQYDHFGLEHSLAWHSLAALTDFGVCSSPLLASRLGPEVKRTPEVPRDPHVPFGKIPPGVHVLNYTFLPPFSRDPYCLFKWGVFRSKGMPRAPDSVTLQCEEALAYIDEHQASFSRRCASHDLMRHVFDQSRLGALLPTPKRTSGAQKFKVQDQDRAAVLKESTALLRECSAVTPGSPLSPQKQGKRDDDAGDAVLERSPRRLVLRYPARSS